MSITKIWSDLKASVAYFASGTVGAIHVAIVDGSGNQITSFGGSGGTSMVDGAAFTVTSSQATPVMGLYEASPSSVADGQVGALGMTADRKLKVSGSFSASPITAATSTLSNVVESAATKTVLAANSARLSFTIINDSDAAVNLKFGATASATSFSYRVGARGRLSTTDVGVNYTGKIDGIWESAPGTSGHDSARVSELTA